MLRRSLVKGFSLVELMIALALGSIITTGVVQLFVANSETHNLLVGQSRMQESARFALEFIGRQVRQAGYRGCFSSNDQLNSTINPPASLPYEFDLRFGIEGFEATGVKNWTPALTALPNTDEPLSVFATINGYGAGNGINIGTVASGSDLVTFRHLSQTDARLGGFIADDGSLQFGNMPTSDEPIVVGILQGWAEFDQDHIVMIHDCEKATMFRVTTANPWGRNADDSPGQAPADANLTIGHDEADTDATRNITRQLALINTFGIDAAVSAIESHTFYVAPGEGVNNEGNTPLSLWRKSTLEAPIELVEGVEGLQVLYGADTDADGIPNQYLAASQVTDWTTIVTVRVTVVVNSVDTVGGTTMPTLGCEVQEGCVDDGETFDGLVRRSFSQTIQLRNHG